MSPPTPGQPVDLVRTGKPVLVGLRKDLTRSVKRGHAWLYSDAIDMPQAAAGSVCILHDRRSSNRIASGIYDPGHAIPVRVCRTEQPLTLGNEWCSKQLQQATNLRSAYFSDETSGIRLVAGEGDCLPGLVIDQYDDTAVIKLDGGAPEAFYQPRGIANWLTENLAIHTVVLRPRGKGRAAEILVGHPPLSPISFLENGLRFAADVMHGQKTGFFLDQRDNRALINGLSHGRRVLNLFSYSGGFSVAAGAGGAEHVTSVDLSPAAIEAAGLHWAANDLHTDRHTGVVADCFGFLEEAIQQRQKWDLVICDPPSFAPSKKARASALAGYGRLALLASKVTRSQGLLALASCSSHIDRDDFLETNLSAPLAEADERLL